MNGVRLSPDGKSVAIRSVYDENGDMAYGVMHSANGGHWASWAEVQGWQPLDLPQNGPPTG
jgi:hypothetical protein